ncbi:2-dehydropantoate 2-reductase [Bradyrhizobium sp. USDA 4454]
MRILVIGAGALGGYFGARLLEAGRDVAFLVRPPRAIKLQAGLLVESVVGGITIPDPPTITADRLNQPYDLILLSCKAYDLQDAMDAMAPAVHDRTLILPVLNGMSHMDALNARFERSKILGGWCAISATMNDQGKIQHLQPFHTISFGEQEGGKSVRTEAVKEALTGAKFDVSYVDNIVQEMWEKWIFIAAAAGATSLMRGSVGDIVAANSVDLTVALFDECVAIATSCGFAPSKPAVDRYLSILTAPNSPFTASMLRDIEAGQPIEADHIVGDLLKKARDTGSSPTLLSVAYSHLKTYESRRSRDRFVS